MLSVDAQVHELKALAHKQGLKVVDVLTEARSAKAPGRPVFSELIRKISRGQVNKILCWKLDRLARNPVDGGAIIWAIKQQRLEIITPTQTYSTAEDNAIMMYIEFGMAQKYIDDLSQNVKRGNRMKLEQGGYPGKAPQGYYNDLSEHTIEPDPVLFPLVRKMWDLLLTGIYNVPQIAHIANEEWGFCTRKTKRTGGYKLHLSSLYRLFSNPFYYGMIERRLDGTLQTFPGAHKPMISEDEFHRAQELLGRTNRPRSKKHIFAYTGLMRCGECFAAITAEEHWKGSKRYCYYRCTKKIGPCSQPFISSPTLEAQIKDILDQITISDAFKEWVLTRLRRMHDQEVGARTAMYQTQQKTYNNCQEQLDKLLSIHLRGLLTEDEYAQKREALQREQTSLALKLDDIEDRASSWLENAEKALFFAKNAKKHFDEGTDSQKREIVAALGSNFILKDRAITIDLQKPFRLVQEANANSKKSRLTPRSFASGRAKATTFERLVDKLHRYFSSEITLPQDVPTLQELIR